MPGDFVSVFYETEQNQIHLRGSAYALCKTDHVYPTDYFSFLNVGTFLCLQISIVITSNLPL